MVVAVCAWPGSTKASEGGPPSERGPGDPIFVRWLDPGDPRDQTILHYWRQAERGELSPFALVDLGTMLFERGYPKDALRVYQRALDEDKSLYESWFRIGLVKHREGELDDARYAYRKCLKLLTGHGWCNFYLGLLEEQDGHPSKALESYRRAFKFAPELADPTVNPAVLYSELQLGAALRRQDHDRFTEALPFGYLEPDHVAEVRALYQPTPALGPAAGATAPAVDEVEPGGGGTVEVQLVPAPTPTPNPTTVLPRESVPFGIGGQREEKQEKRSE
jgi:hypothetical protein